jgi:anthranilate phosphoribosyltransferase
MTDLIRTAITTVAAGRPLPEEQAEAFLGAVLDGEVTPAQLGAVLLGMRVRGEAASELTGFVRALRARVLVVEAPAGTIDTCGTGGDVHQTFNISTASSIVTAAAGVPVAKTGNRAVSGISGSSDVMGALGLTVEQSPQEASASLREDGYAYLHAPAFHPGMRHAGAVRRELGVRTAFNLVGPIANAALPRRQLVGVPDEESARRVADTLQALGTEHAWVVTGDHIDELPLDGSGMAFVVTPDGVERRTISARDAGLPAASTAELAGGDPFANAAIVEAVLAGSLQGPPRAVVVLNAGAALVVSGRAKTLREGAEMAQEAIESGAAADRLARLRSRALARSAAVAAT